MLVVVVIVVIILLLLSCCDSVSVWIQKRFFGSVGHLDLDIWIIGSASNQKSMPNAKLQIRQYYGGTNNYSSVGCWKWFTETETEKCV